MSGEKKTYRYEAFLPSPGYMFTQTAMLFLNYGLRYDMSWWVIWFPSIIYVLILIFILLVMIILAIGSAIGDRH